MVERRTVTVFMAIEDDQIHTLLDFIKEAVLIMVKMS